MAGHSKFKNIQHRKGAQDKKRAKIFGRLIKELTVAARSGTDPDSNPRLRTALAAARSANMPKDNIERVLKRVRLLFPLGAWVLCAGHLDGLIERGDVAGSRAHGIFRKRILEVGVLWESVVDHLPNVVRVGPLMRTQRNEGALLAAEAFDLGERTWRDVRLIADDYDG